MAGKTALPRNLEEAWSRLTFVVFGWSLVVAWLNLVRGFGCGWQMIICLVANSRFGIYGFRMFAAKIVIGGRVLLEFLVVCLSNLFELLLRELEAA